MDQVAVARKMAVFRIQGVVAELRRRESTNYKGCSVRDKKLFMAIKSMLKARTKDEPFDQNDVDQIRKIQSLPILRYHDPREENAQGTQLLNPVMELPRIFVEHLTRYFDCFVETPGLINDNPVGLCPKCDFLFMKKRLDKRYCSRKCREKAWREQRKEEAPDFFAKKAKFQRKHRTPEEMKRQAQKICKRLGGFPARSGKGEKEQEIQNRLVGLGFRRAKKLSLAEIRALCLPPDS